MCLPRYLFDLVVWVVYAAMQATPMAPPAVQEPVKDAESSGLALSGFTLCIKVFYMPFLVIISTTVGRDCNHRAACRPSLSPGAEAIIQPHIVHVAGQSMLDVLSLFCVGMKLSLSTNFDKFPPQRCSLCRLC